MLLNDAKFADNGGCGYVLKPPSMTGAAALDKTQKVSIKIISGWQLPKPSSADSKSHIVDPYVKVALYGVPTQIQGDFIRKTEVVKNNGFHPVWNKVLLFPSFLEEDIPSVVLVFLVCSGTEVLARRAIPLTCIQSGYRVVNLLSVDGKPLEESSLLCYFLWKEYGDSEGWVQRTDPLLGLKLDSTDSLRGTIYSELEEEEEEEEGELGTTQMDPDFLIPAAPADVEDSLSSSFSSASNLNVQGTGAPTADTSGKSSRRESKGKPTRFHRLREHLSFDRGRSPAGRWQECIAREPLTCVLCSATIARGRAYYKDSNIDPDEPLNRYCHSCTNR
jgi:hypothetical protein